MTGAQGETAPARLAQALHYAVTPGGARIRPTILLSVAMACGDDRPALADAAAYAKRINSVAFPHYTDADWDAFARRIFRQ